jgi:hypothetical protein
MRFFGRCLLAVMTLGLVLGLPALPAFAAGTINLYNDPVTPREPDSCSRVATRCTQTQPR